MKEVGILERDVFDLEGKIIASGGTALTPEFMHTIARSGPRQQGHIRLFEDPVMLSDLRQVLSEDNYKIIFGDEEPVRQVIEAMSSVEVHPAVVQGLLRFKEIDYYTYRHCLMVAALATLVSPELPSVYQRSEEATTVAPGHDIGKLSVPKEILHKTEPLTKSELALIQGHAASGFVLLTYYMGYESPKSCQVAYEHHERRDGSGYPRGIRLDDEVVELVAVCDAFDALVSARPYRDTPFDRRTALEVLSDEAEKGKFGWIPVKLLISHHRKEKVPVERLVVSKKRRGKTPRRNLHGTTSD